MGQEFGTGQMKIFIKLMKTISVDVHRNDTVDDLKAKIYSKEGVRIAQQELYFDGNHLDNTKTLSYYNISSNSNLDLCVTDGMQIHIKIPSISKDFFLNVERTDIIATLKSMIQNKSGISSIRQTVTFSGLELENNQVLEKCGINDGSTLHVLVSPTEEICISVQIAQNRAIKLHVKRWYSVGDLRLIIERMEGFSANSQMLSYQFVGNYLQDRATLSECNIKDGSVLKLKLHPIQIFVKTSENKTITLTVSSNDTVEQAMKIIEGKLSYKLKKHYLCYRGCVLQKENTIGFYNIMKDAFIELRVRLSYYSTKCEKRVVSE